MSAGRVTVTQWLLSEEAGAAERLEEGDSDPDPECHHSRAARRDFCYCDEFICLYLLLYSQF